MRCASASNTHVRTYMRMVLSANMLRLHHCTSDFPHRIFQEHLSIPIHLSDLWPSQCITHNPLQVLAHTIAHEMVHALVFHLFPAMDAASVAYLPDDRHGPIFKLLNRQLFGHSIDSFRPVFRTCMSVCPP